MTIICQLQVRQLDFNIGSGIAKTLEQELVQARSEDKSLDAAVFHVWLTVRRAGPMVMCQGHCFTSSSCVCRQSWFLAPGLAWPDCTSCARHLECLHHRPVPLACSWRSFKPSAMARRR